MGHESGLKHAGAAGLKLPREVELVPPGEDAGRLSDEEILSTLEQNQLSEVRKLARAHTVTAINTLSQICKNKKLPPAPRVTAAKALLDYGHGRPGQQFDPKQAAGSSGDKLRVVILKLADGSMEEIKELDVTPGAAPVHEQIGGQRSVVEGVAILELDR